MQLVLRRQIGFTLVEIMMVVVIVGIMAAFAIPSYTKSVGKAYEKAGSNNLLIIYAAQKMKILNGAIPVAGDITAINDSSGSGLGLSIMANGIDYSCTQASPNFTCTAARSTGDFSLQITQTGSICCSKASCPSVPGC